MNFKKIIFFLFAIALVFSECYLVASLVWGKINQDKDVQNFCQQKCVFNSSNSYWEFSGEYSTKGFTTKNECFNYCSKVRQGFAAVFTSYAPAYFTGLFDELK